jgi:hypothetical protein
MKSSQPTLPESSRRSSLFSFSSVKASESKASGRNLCLRFKINLEKSVICVKDHKNIYDSAHKNHANRDVISKHLEPLSPHIDLNGEHAGEAQLFSTIHGFIRTSLFLKQRHRDDSTRFVWYDTTTLRLQSTRLGCAGILNVDDFPTSCPSRATNRSHELEGFATLSVRTENRASWSSD